VLNCTYLLYAFWMVTSVCHPHIILYLLLQSKQIHEIKDFLLTARRKDPPLCKSRKQRCCVVQGALFQVPVHLLHLWHGEDEHVKAILPSRLAQHYMCNQIVHVGMFPTDDSLYFFHDIVSSSAYVNSLFKLHSFCSFLTVLVYNIIQYQT
jgi:hypothetical protein